MSIAKEKICRLCLKMLDDGYNVIEEMTTGILEFLLLKVDLSVSEEPVVCKGCMKNIQGALAFKSICISVDKQVVSLAIDRNSAELDIRDVYLNYNENKGLAFSVDHNICRICLECQENSNFNLLNDQRKNSADKMLVKCIPELDLNIIKEPMICTACMKALEGYYSFAMKCQNIEENIIKYCKIQETEGNGQISLSNILNFLFKSTVEGIDNCSKTAVIKEEDSSFKNEEDTYSNLNNIITKIEKQEVVIKDENKYEDCRSEEDRCGDPKRNEVMCDQLTHKDYSNVVIYTCESCTYETKYMGHLKRHVLIHKDSSEVTMYKCNLCSYESKWKDKIRRHMPVHYENLSNTVLHKCEKCTYKTKYKVNLKKHMLIHKDNSEVTMHKCNICSYESKFKYYLKKHMLTHKNSSDVVMYGCERCAFETKYKDNLKRHVLIHRDKSEVTSDVVMYRCEKCKFQSKYRESLKRHMTGHKNKTELRVQM